ncbi:unnamed protein product, partial [Larinioides sclopetarius]
QKLDLFQTEKVPLAGSCHSLIFYYSINFILDNNMDRVVELMRNLFVPTSLGGIIRNYNAIVGNYLRSRKSSYEEIGSNPDTSCWLKLIIYLGSAVTIILSIIAFAFGYVIIPTIVTLTAVVCATLFWFRYSVVWVRLLECSRTVFCFPCIYFSRPSPLHAEIEYERRHREAPFERSVEVHSNGAEVQSEAETNGAKEQPAAQSPSSETSSEIESSITNGAKSAKV